MNNKGYILIGIIEIILILVVLIALIVLFKDQLETIVKNAFDAITGGANNIIE